MKEKHTPGPWKTMRGADDDPTRWIVVAAGAEREYVIATVENGQPGDCLDTEAATARLIAAAPELLEALKRLSVEVSGLLGTIEHEMREAAGHTNVNVLVQRWTEAKAAILKAEGV